MSFTTDCPRVFRDDSGETFEPVADLVFVRDKKAELLTLQLKLKQMVADQENENRAVSETPIKEAFKDVDVLNDSNVIWLPISKESLATPGCFIHWP